MAKSYQHKKIPPLTKRRDFFLKLFNLKAGINIHLH